MLSPCIDIAFPGQADNYMDQFRQDKLKVNATRESETTGKKMSQVYRNNCL